LQSLENVASLSEPSYLRLYRSGELSTRIEQARMMLTECTLCPHRCRINRLEGQLGVCRMGATTLVASYNDHHWEEPCISGTRGSGTIFFSGCTGRCSFCQNYPISQMNRGNLTDDRAMADMMVRLQKRGVHNINFVTPTHFVPQILAALPHAIERGFSLPLVYNSSGYDSVKTLHLLDGIIDVYLPDAKYAEDDVARCLSGFPGYVESNRAALLEMFRQVGAELILDDQGIARRGMIIRHLVLPAGLAGSREVFRWLATNLSPDIHLSVMAQYFPAYHTVDDPVLGRRITLEEYDDALADLEEAGLDEGWIQDMDDEIL
jgi:putative pyruvate formate lyase activating enzyme